MWLPGRVLLLVRLVVCVFLFVVVGFDGYLLCLALLVMLVLLPALDWFLFMVDSAALLCLVCIAVVMLFARLIALFAVVLLDAYWYACAVVWYVAYCCFGLCCLSGVLCCLLWFIVAASLWVDSVVFGGFDCYCLSVGSGFAGAVLLLGLLFAVWCFAVVVNFAVVCFAGFGVV